MKVEARLSFRLGRVMEVLQAHGYTLKRLAQEAGWDYGSLTSYLRFQGRAYPTRPEKCDLLFQVLQKLDPTITWEEVFPKEYMKAKLALGYTRTVNQDIPSEMLVPYREIKQLEVRDESYEEMERQKDARKIALKGLYLLTHTEHTIVRLYHGIGGGRPRTFSEIGMEVNLTGSRVQQLYRRAIEKLRNKLWHHFNRVDLGLPHKHDSEVEVEPPAIAQEKAAVLGREILRRKKAEEEEFRKNACEILEYFQQPEG